MGTPENIDRPPGFANSELDRTARAPLYAPRHVSCIRAGMTRRPAPIPPKAGGISGHPVAFAMALALAFAFSLLAVTYARPAFAQPDKAKDSTAALGADDLDGDKQERVMPDSPRASMLEFFALTRGQDFEEASRYLDLPSGYPQAQATELARRLDAVLRRHLEIDRDLDYISASSEGDRTDAQRADVDEIGRVPMKGARASEAVLIVKREEPDGRKRWKFSRTTVQRVNRWYEALDGVWIREQLPPSLLRPGPRGVLWWQWLAFPVLAGLALLLGQLLGRVTRALVRWVFRKHPAFTDQHLLDRFAPPVRLAWAVVLLVLCVPYLALDRSAADFVRSLLRIGFLFALFWALVRAVDFVVQAAKESPWGRLNPPAAGLMPLLGKLVKIALVVIAVVQAISELGYPVASILAGLGIGGLAIALAAQKTVENLFGAAALGLDEPFRIGDFISVDGVIGTVEALGLRSTRIRTLDRTVITIPNSKIADMRIENFAARDRFRLHTVLSLEYDTKLHVIRQITELVRKALEEKAPLAPVPPVVFFNKLGRDTLDIEVMAWFQVPDWNAFQAARQEALLMLMGIVREAGAEFAFPTTTVHLARDGKETSGSVPARA
jgi:MscS family membrane protein